MSESTVKGSLSRLEAAIGLVQPGLQADILRATASLFNAIETGTQAADRGDAVAAALLRAISSLAVATAGEAFVERGSSASVVPIREQLHVVVNQMGDAAARLGKAHAAQEPGQFMRQQKPGQSETQR